MALQIPSVPQSPSPFSTPSQIDNSNGILYYHNQSPSEPMLLHDNQQKKRRAGRACLSCRARKVRCNVNERQPCDNCERDVAQCVVPRTRRSRKILSELYRSPGSDEGSRTYSQTVYCDANDARAVSAAFRSNAREPETPNSSRSQTSSHNMTPNDQPVPQDLGLPPFIAPVDSMSPAYLEFLRKQDAFKLPSAPLQRELLKAFIEFAYGRMPVVDLDAHCRILELGDGSGGQMSILLYQAVLFAGAAHASSKFVEDNGWASKKALRRDLYHRVQLLFELGMEADSLVEIQAALLLTSKSVHPGDKKGSWHWVNEAISRAFTLGLHKDDCSSYRTSDRSLRRRIWWCCYARDKIVALGLGQPTRIKDRDFNVQQLTYGDLEHGVLENGRMLLGELQVGPLSQLSELQSNELLMEKTKLTIIIEDVLREVAGFTTIPADTFASLDARLQLWLLNLPESCRQPTTMSSEVQLDNLDISNQLRRHLLHMAFHTAVYTLHRPRCIPHSPYQVWKLPGSTTEREASSKAVFNSARHITLLAADLHQRNLDINLPMTAITIICPAIFMHLLNMKSPVRTSREHAAYSFRVCMRTMERLRSLYSCTDTTISYLENVLRKISVAVNDLPGFPASIQDIFWLNKRDQSDITAVLGTSTPRPATRSSISSELAMGLNGLDSLLSEEAACDGEMDINAIARPGQDDFAFSIHSPPRTTNAANGGSGQGDGSFDVGWDRGCGGPTLFDGTMTPLGLDLDVGMYSDLFSGHSF